MANSLQEERLKSAIRLLYFKYRGDLVKILDEIRTRYEHEVDHVGEERITLDYIRKVIDKFKRQEKTNDPFVATWIMEYVFMGTKQRELLWHGDDQNLDEFKYLYRSVCCDKATEQRKDPSTNEEFFVCLKCNNRCQVYRIPNLDVFEVQRRIRVEKRKDEEQLVKAVESLGFGGEKAPVIRQTNFQVITGGAEMKRDRKRVQSLPVENRKLIENVSDMEPQDRETVIKQLEQIKRDVTKEDKLSG